MLDDVDQRVILESQDYRHIVEETRIKLDGRRFVEDQSVLMI